MQCQNHASRPRCLAEAAAGAGSARQAELAPGAVADAGAALERREDLVAIEGRRFGLRVGFGRGRGAGGGRAGEGPARSPSRGSTRPASSQRLAFQSEQIARSLSMLESKISIQNRLSANSSDPLNP